MKKKLAIILVVCLICLLAVGTTLSYFTDSDGATNTMTVGKVAITQHEYYRNAEGVATEWHPENGTAYAPRLYPFTGTDTMNDTYKIDNVDYKMYDTNKNAIDKIVTVSLDADSEAAYVRTLFAFEAVGETKTNPIGDAIFLNINSDGGVWEQCKNGEQAITFEKDNVTYYLYSYTYKEKLTTGTTVPSLLQFYLDNEAGNEFSGGSYNILVLSQGVQAQGFDSATEALNAAFPYDAAKIAGWFTNVLTTN